MCSCILTLSNENGVVAVILLRDPDTQLRTPCTGSREHGHPAVRRRVSSAVILLSLSLSSQMVLEIQRWPGVWRVERMLMGKSEGRQLFFNSSLHSGYI